jgi:hypothetical protein
VNRIVSDQVVTSPVTRSRYPRWSRLAVVAVAVAALGILPGPQTSLVLLGVVTTFFQPLQTLIAAWTSWRPSTRRGAIATLAALLIAAAVVTVGAQAAIGHVDLAGLVTTHAYDHGHPVLSTFPVLITPAALVFVIFLQITMVWEMKPFDRIRAPWAGIVALAVSSAVAVLAYAILTNWHALPPSLHAAGLRDPNGPIAGSSIATWLICVAAWQVIVMLVLDGRPGSLLRTTSGRIVANNFAVIGAASLSYRLADMADVAGPTVAAVAACIVAGSRIALVLGDHTMPLTVARKTAVATAWSLAVYAILRFVAGHATFDTQPAGLWIAVVALNLLSGAVTFAADLLPPIDQRSAAGPNPA